MEKSFRVYVNIFDDNNADTRTLPNNNLEKSLDSYDVVTENDITGNSENGGNTDFAISHTLSQDPPGNNTEKTFVNSSIPEETQTVSISKEDINRTKLCGFLKVHKPGDKTQGRRRWFVFSEESCRLLYFRTPQDFIPRCDIDISSASFFMQAPACDNTSLNRFEIRTKENVYVLETADQKTMLYWLQELQNHREQYVASRSRTLSMRLTVPPDIITDSDIDDNHPASATGTVPLVENVSLPRDTVGLQTKDTHPAGGNFHFTNLRDELRKMVSGMWQQKHWKRTNETEETERSPPLRNHSNHVGFNLKRTIKAKSADVKQRIMKGTRLGDDSGDDGLPSMPRSASADTVCNRCSVYEDQIGVSKEELQSVEEELQATREITWILQKQIDEFVREKSIQCSLSESLNIQDTQMAILQEQEKKIINLEHLLAATQEEKEILKCTNRSLEADIVSYRDQIAAFQDSVRAKDDMVINLTEQLLSKETQIQNRGTTRNNITFSSSPQNQQFHLSPQGSPLKSSDIQENKELTKLRDMVNGYKMQNQFLNKEIMQLNKLRQEDNTRLQELSQTCLKLETCYYDEHRKYLACLKELGKNQNDDDPGSLQILQQLLEDALLSRKQWSGAGESRKLRKSTASLDELNIEPRFDVNGFPINKNESYEDDSFDDRLATIEKESDELYVKAKSIEEGLSASLQWEKYVANIGLGTTAQRSKELKHLIRAGIPNVHRSTVWKWCVDFSVKNIKSGFREYYYEHLIKSIKDSHLMMDPTAKQIELDLLRTLPGNKFYENITSEKVQALRRILLAFSLHDPVVGYCQGLNRITAIALLFLDEEDAFWCLLSIVNCLLPQNYFCAGMQGAHADQRVLSDLVQEKLPAVYHHLKQVDVDLTVFTFNWFLTIFIDSIPPQMYFRIWDSFLYEGCKILFRYAIAFLKYRESEILSITDSSQMHLCLRSLGQRMFDVNKVSKIAFEGMNPFPMKNIYGKRQHHLVIVKEELDRMEERRESYRKKKVQSQDLMSFDDTVDSKFVA